MNTNLMFSSATDEWETPQAFYNALNSEFHFTMDVCATPENAKCERFYTREQDGLSQDWTGETVFCNPPYGREMPKWIEKCAKHGLFGGGHCRNAHSSPDGHKGVSPMDIRESGNPVHQRALEVRQQQ